MPVPSPSAASDSRCDFKNTAYTGVCDDNNSDDNSSDVALLGAIYDEDEAMVRTTQKSGL